LECGETSLKGFPGYFLRREFMHSNNDFWVYEITFIEAEEKIVTFFFCAPSGVMRRKASHVEYVKMNFSFLER
jgi:hypothetical protein